MSKVNAGDHKQRFSDRQPDDMTQAEFIETLLDAYEIVEDSQIDVDASIIAACECTGSDTDAWEVLQDAPDWYGRCRNPECWGDNPDSTNDTDTTTDTMPDADTTTAEPKIESDASVVRKIGTTHKRCHRSADTRPTSPPRPACNADKLLGEDGDWEEISVERARNWCEPCRQPDCWGDQ